MKRGQPMRRSELVRRTPLRSTAPLTSRCELPRATRIRPVSVKRARETRAYTLLRREFLAAHPRCEFPGGCTQPATEIHHRRGRVGALYLNTAHWSPLCHDHHAWATEHPAAAFEMGVSERRIGGAA